MQKLISFSLLIVFSWCIFAQDERQIQSLFREKSGGINESAFSDYRLDQKQSWEVEGLKLLFDLDGDGKSEKLFFKKIDGNDYFVITSENNLEIFNGKLDNLGTDSYLYKIQIISISKYLNSIVLHYYEGNSKYFEQWGSARIYLLTYQRDDIKKNYFFKGPSVYVEHESHLKNYYQEFYKIEFKDINKDGTKEMLLNKENWQKVWYYHEQGVWKNP